MDSAITKHSIQRFALNGVAMVLIGVGSQWVLIPETSIYAITASCETISDCENLLSSLKTQLAELFELEQDKAVEKETLQAERFTLRTQVTKIQTAMITLKGEILTLEEDVRLYELKKSKLDFQLTIQKDALFRQVRLNQRYSHQNKWLTLLSETESWTDVTQTIRSLQAFHLQSKGRIETLSDLVRELNETLTSLESAKAALVEKRDALKEQEAQLVEEMTRLIALEQELQQEIQQLQSLQMEADEIKAIVEDQKQTITAEVNQQFRLPLATGYVTCEVGCYLDSNGIPHTGIDMGNYGNTSTPVIASAAGVVTRAGWHNAYGYHVMITHNIRGEIYTTVYGHLHQTPQVQVGETVEQGQQLGTMGNTGNSSGAHLHFELYEGYYNFPHSVNPRQYLTFPTYW